MSRQKKYIDSDVLTEARKRMRRLYDEYDHVCVSFSGGKDSLVCLHLAREVVEERRLGKVHALFYDEELIPDSVLDFVNEYRQKEWLDLIWLCVPLESNKFVLGNTVGYVQWDPNRQHIRKKPPWAVTLESGDDRVMSQYKLNDFVTTRFFSTGSVAQVVGLRADESLVRLRAHLNNLKSNWICTAASEPKAGPGAKRTWLAKPIYDWSENDVFKFLGEHGIRYCPIYDAQMWSRTPLRVSTPVHSEAAKHIGKLREVAPTLYEQVIALFPDMAIQDRYWSEIDGDRIKMQYGQTWDGVRQYVYDYYEDRGKAAKALDRIAMCQRMAENRPGSYTPEYVLGYIRGGSIKRQLLSLAKG